MDMVKMLASFVMGSVGLFFLYRGKKIADIKLMIIGGILVLASYFLFS